MISVCIRVLVRVLWLQCLCWARCTSVQVYFSLSLYFCLASWAASFASKRCWASDLRVSSSIFAVLALSSSSSWLIRSSLSFTSRSFSTSLSLSFSYCLSSLLRALSSSDFSMTNALQSASRVRSLFMSSTEIDVTSTDLSLQAADHWTDWLLVWLFLTAGSGRVCTCTALLTLLLLVYVCWSTCSILTSSICECLLGLNSWCCRVLSMFVDGWSISSSTLSRNSSGDLGLCWCCLAKSLLPLLFDWASL